MKRKKGGQIGNQNNKKLKDPDIRKEAYRQYCEHIAGGWSKESFVFDHPTLTVTFKTMERYIREEPFDFPSIQKEQAEAKSLYHWEDLGKKMMVGHIEGKIQPAIYQMFMRNKFQWDREMAVSHSFEPEARRLLNIWEKQHERKD